MREELQRDPTDAEVAEATGMTVHQLRRRLDVGRAARNKLIKVNAQLICNDDMQDRQTNRLKLGICSTTSGWFRTP